ncbi:hypothetical protein BH20ACT2_BH20ACT2_11710 [soil metagenome]
MSSLHSKPRQTATAASSKALPDDVRDAMPGVPWTNLMKARDLYVHRHGDVEPDLVWNALEDDLPEFGAAIDVPLVQTEQIDPAG